jgi:hypothetical protein
MRIKGHPEKRLLSESWSSFSRRILGDNISNSKSEYGVSHDREQNNCCNQASGHAAWDCQIWKLIIPQGSVADEAKPQTGPGKKQGE